MKSAFSKAYQTVFTASVIGISYALYFIFLVVPNERLMGPVQRIFYFHVGSAITCYCAVAVVFIAGLWYLASTSKLADIISESAAEVGFVFCSITLISGMIWGHSAWNTWFRWEPRLVSFLLLWFVLLSFLLLRKFGDQERVASHSAVLGIVGAIMVPIVVFSVKFLPGIPQLHPVVVENNGLKDPLFKQGMWLSVGALFLLQALLISLRSRIGILQQR